MPATRATDRSRPARHVSVLRLGWVALNDAAPFIVAEEAGLFAQHGVRVELNREVGWATVRDKIVYGELDAAHAPAGLLVSTRLGLGCPPTDCLTACVLNVHGNAITLSERLWQQGVRDATSLRALIVRERHDRKLVLGTVSSHSGHHLHLIEWLRSGGIDPAQDVRIVIVPPAQVFRNLVAGTIDGYCVGEPWNSLAVREGAGWCPAVSRDLHPGHIEKVLMVRESFAVERNDQHLALVAALVAAAARCDDPGFRPQLPRLLASRRYLNLPEPVVAAGLTGAFDCGHGHTLPDGPIVEFHQGGLNDPRPEKFDWVLQGFRRHRLLAPHPALSASFTRDIARTDLFHQARHRHLLDRHEPANTSSR